MSVIDKELLDRRDFSETADAILYARPRFTTVFFPLFALVFFAALGWLAFVPFEETVHARGGLRVAGDAVPVEAQQEGRLIAVAAREGASVERGAVLFRLDESRARMELERVDEEMARVRQTIALAEGRRERARNRGAVEVGRIAGDAARQRAMYERGIVAKQMVDTLESERRARAEASRQEQLTIEAEAVAARQALARLEGERAQALRALEEHVIRAEASGVVTRLRATSPGRIVPRGAVLAEITPRGRAMELEAIVGAQDVGRVRPGLPARIELDAYPQRQFGAIEGTVTFVAPDRDERGYRVRIATERLPRGVELRTGMTGSVDVISDRQPLYRTVGEHLGFLR